MRSGNFSKKRTPVRMIPWRFGLPGGRGALGASPAPHRLRRRPGRDLSRCRMRERAADGEPRRVGRRRWANGRTLRTRPDPLPRQARPGATSPVGGQDLRRKRHGLGTALPLRLRAHGARVRSARPPSGAGREIAYRVPCPRRTSAPTAALAATKRGPSRSESSYAPGVTKSWANPKPQTRTAPSSPESPGRTLHVPPPTRRGGFQTRPKPNSTVLGRATS